MSIQARALSSAFKKPLTLKATQIEFAEKQDNLRSVALQLFEQMTLKRRNVTPMGRHENEESAEIEATAERFATRNYSNNSRLGNTLANPPLKRHTITKLEKHSPRRLPKIGRAMPTVNKTRTTVMNESTMNCTMLLPRVNSSVASADDGCDEITPPAAARLGSVECVTFITASAPQERIELMTPSRRKTQPIEVDKLETLQSENPLEEKSSLKTNDSSSQFSSLPVQPKTTRAVARESIVEFEVPMAKEIFEIKKIKVNAAHQALMEKEARERKEKERAKEVIVEHHAVLYKSYQVDRRASYASNVSSASINQVNDLIKFHDEMQSDFKCHMEEGGLTERARIEAIMQYQAELEGNHGKPKDYFLVPKFARRISRKPASSFEVTEAPKNRQNSLLGARSTGSQSGSQRNSSARGWGAQRVTTDAINRRNHSKVEPKKDENLSENFAPYKLQPLDPKYKELVDMQMKLLRQEMWEKAHPFGTASSRKGSVQGKNSDSGKKSMQAYKFTRNEDDGQKVISLVVESADATPQRRGTIQPSSFNDNVSAFSQRIIVEDPVENGDHAESPSAISGRPSNNPMSPPVTKLSKNRSTTPQNIHLQTSSPRKDGSVYARNAEAYQAKLSAMSSPSPDKKQTMY